MTDNTQPEALRLALSIDLMDTFTDYQQEELNKAAAELRRQHDRIAELESELEAIGAGGVTGPLMGQPQAMPHWVQYEETSDVLLIHGKRYAAGIFGKAGFLGPPGTLLRVECGDADCVTLTRVPLSENAGEPVAWLYESPMPDGSVFTGASAERLQVGVGTPTGTIEKPLYLAAPPTAQAEGWTKLPGQLPEPGMPVLLDIGKKYPIRAMWAAKRTVQSADDDTDWGEYDEDSGEYWCPEGWYEWNQHEETHWAVSETPRAWMLLPPTSAEWVKHG